MDQEEPDYSQEQFDADLDCINTLPSLIAKKKYAALNVLLLVATVIIPIFVGLTFSKWGHKAVGGIAIVVGFYVMATIRDKILNWLSSRIRQQAYGASSHTQEDARRAAQNLRKHWGK